MIPPPPPAGLPVVSTRTRVLDHLHGFMVQETARGDLVFVRQSFGVLVEIAVVPVDAKPILRWQEVDAKLQPLLDKELPGADPLRPVNGHEWRKLDEQHWEEEIAALFKVLVEWMQANGQLTMTYEMWQTEAVAPGVTR